MVEKPANKLDPRVKAVWRIQHAILVTIIGLVLGGIIFLLSKVFNFGTLPYTILGVALVLAYIIFVGITPAFVYSRFRYELSDDYLDIWKKKSRCIIPFIRVQDIQMKHGLLMRAFKLADVTISTAANDHVIPGLALDTAEQLRNRAAELARLAHEDV